MPGGKGVNYLKKTEAVISSAQAGSLAEEAGLECGDTLLLVNGHEVHDILEYRYLISEYEVTLTVRKKNGDIEEILIENDYEDLGIEFKSGLIDTAQRCRNKCIFCFIDQLPDGMRETVYFKDDDTRLSFLQGNYVTLTNLSDEEIDRMLALHISPINISVHTTNPELRIKMLKNKNAGKINAIMRRFFDNGIYMNCQIVLCPGYNDKEELSSTLETLAALHPYVESVSVVPVGLTRYREGLCRLTPFDARSSYETIIQVEELQKKFLERLGTRLVYLSDEFYLNAGLNVPTAEDYEGFPQLENGVGLVASMKEEFDEALKHISEKPLSRRVMIATGELAHGFISGLCRTLSEKISGLYVDVCAVKNDFFGGGVNVSGLVVGRDIINQLSERPKCDVLLIPSSMLRDGENVFLDDTTTDEVEAALGMKIIAVANDGYEFTECVTGRELVLD